MSRILMLVINPMTSDSRVEKEATALGGVGHQVTVVATAGPGLDRIEARAAYTVLRLPYRQAVKERAIGRWVRTRSRVPAQLRALEAAASSGSPDLLAHWHKAVLRFRKRLARLTWAGWGITLRLIRSRTMVPEYWDSIASQLPRLVEPPHVIHAHDLCTLAAAVRLAKAWGRHPEVTRRPKVVFDSHELYVEQNPDWTLPQKLLWQLHELRWIRRADLIITVSPGIALELRRRYRLRSEPMVVYNSPSVDYLASVGSVRPDSGVPAERCLAVYVGAVKPGRGVERLLPAMVGWRDWDLAVVGAGDSANLDTLRDLASELSVDDRIHMLPAVPARVLPRYLASADVGVHPMEPTCLNHDLALPNKLFDYVFAGLPVAVSRLSEMRAFVERHGAGAVFDPEDPDSVADAIRAAANLPTRPIPPTEKEPGPWKEYHWAAQAEKLIEAYDRMLPRSPLGSLADHRNQP